MLIMFRILIGEEGTTTIYRKDNKTIYAQDLSYTRMSSSGCLAPEAITTIVIVSIVVVALIIVAIALYILRKKRKILR